MGGPGRSKPSAGSLHPVSLPSVRVFISFLSKCDAPCFEMNSVNGCCFKMLWTTQSGLPAGLPVRLIEFDPSAEKELAKLGRDETRCILAVLAILAHIARETGSLAIGRGFADAW